MNEKNRAVLAKGNLDGGTQTAYNLYVTSRSGVVGAHKRSVAGNAAKSQQKKSKVKYSSKSYQYLVVVCTWQPEVAWLARIKDPLQGMRQKVNRKSRRKNIAQKAIRAPYMRRCRD